MSKKRKQFTIDDHIADRLEHEVENQSRVVNELLQSYLRKDVDDEVTLQDKKERLEQEIEKLEKEQEKTFEQYQKQIDSRKAELQTVEKKLEEQDEKWDTLESDCGIRISSNFVRDKWTEKHKTRKAVAQEKPVSDVTGNEIETETAIAVDMERGLIWKPETESRPNDNVNDHSRAVLTEVKG